VLDFLSRCVFIRFFSTETANWQDLTGIGCFSVPHPLLLVLSGGGFLRHIENTVLGERKCPFPITDPLLCPGISPSAAVVDYAEECGVSLVPPTAGGAAGTNSDPSALFPPGLQAQHVVAAVRLAAGR